MYINCFKSWPNCARGPFRVSPAVTLHYSLMQWFSTFWAVGLAEQFFKK